MAERVNMDLLRRCHELPEPGVMDERCAGCPYGGHVPVESIHAGDCFCAMGMEEIGANGEVVGLLKLTARPNTGCPEVAHYHAAANEWNRCRTH